MQPKWATEGMRHEMRYPDACMAIFLARSNAAAHSSQVPLECRVSRGTIGCASVVLSTIPCILQRRFFMYRIASSASAVLRYRHVDVEFPFPSIGQARR